MGVELRDMRLGVADSCGEDGARELARDIEVGRVCCGGGGGTMDQPNRAVMIAVLEGSPRSSGAEEEKEDGPAIEMDSAGDIWCGSSSAVGEGNELVSTSLTDLMIFSRA